ncbi:MAG: NAD-dependent epimerase/dehydratase family protein [Pseudomonadota bacterium]
MSDPRGRLLVTGASGFIGQHVCRDLAAAGWHIKVCRRQAGGYQLPTDTTSDDVVVHLGGMAHDQVPGADLAALVEVNAQQTLNLFIASMQAGVRRFVWLSSIKALGDSSITPLKECDPPNPGDDYGRSKAQAERMLLQALEAQPEWAGRLAILRPPLVYGPGVGANFLSMVRWATSSWPLPLAGADAPRAWLSVQNLTHFIGHVATAELGRQVIFHVCDAEQTCVRDMLRLLAQLAGGSARLFFIPQAVLFFTARMVGREGQAQRLLLPLPVSMQATASQLNWQPPIKQANALAEVMTWFPTQN